MSIVRTRPPVPGSLALVFVTALVPAAGIAQGGTTGAVRRDAHRSAGRATALDTALSTAAAHLKAGAPGKALAVLYEVDAAARDARVRQLLVRGHMVRGNGYFEKQRYDLAYRDYYRANRLAPGTTTILQNLGIVCYRLQRPRDAESYMRRVLKLDPGNGHANAVLGRLAEKRGDAAAASRYMNRAAAAGPAYESLRGRAAQLRKEATVEEDFATLERGNFRVQFERGGDAGVDKAVASVHRDLEQAWRELRKDLGGAPRGRVAVVIYNKKQYRRVTGAHAWARAYFDGKIRVAIRNWPAGQAQLRRDLRHELTHAFLRSLHPKTPTWLHEGLAQFVEGRSVGAAARPFRTGRRDLLPARAFLGRFTDTKDGDAASAGYAQSLMLVGHLHTLGGWRRIRSLLREVDRTSRSDAALEIVYRKKLADLLDAARR